MMRTLPHSSLTGIAVPVSMGDEGSEIDELEKALEHVFDMDLEEEEDEDEEGEGEGEGEGEREQEDRDQEEEEGGRGREEEEDNVGEEEEMNAGESVLETDCSGTESHHQKFEGLEYEALAKRKREALADLKGEGSRKKARQDDLSGASLHEIMELMTHGMRKKSRKSKLMQIKKAGRRKGSKNKLNPEIERMLGDAVVHHAHGRHKQAISISLEVVRLAAHVPDSYHILGRVHDALGNTETAMGLYAIAAHLKPNLSLWKILYAWHSKRGDMARARKYLSKAIKADPNDIDLRSSYASLYVELGDNQRAAELYEQIAKICPQKVQELMTAAKLYLKSGRIEQGVGILEDYLQDHPSSADILFIIDFLAAVFMEIKAYNNALQRIERAEVVYYSGEELPLQLKVKAGICHLHLGNVEKAEILFNVCWESTSDHTRLITDVADAYMCREYFQSALKYYHMLESFVGANNEGHIHFKIGQCYSFLKQRAKAIEFFYKALNVLKDGVDTRLALASLLQEEAKEDEAISLLCPPNDLDSPDANSDIHRPWWLDGKIKLKLCYIYRAKGMLEDFVNTILPLVRDSLYVKTNRPKVKKRLTMSVLRERAKVLDIQETADVFGGVRPLASRSVLLQAARARKLLQKREEQKAAARAAGVDSFGDGTNDDCWEEEMHNKKQEEEVRVPPLPNFLEDEKHYDLILDLCKALQSLQRYWEALQIIRLTQRLACDRLPVEKKEELQSLEAQISYNTIDPKHGFDYVRTMVQQHPHNISAWNCYYKISSRLVKGYSKHGKFLRDMRAKHSDCVPPIIISGHHFTVGSFYQDAAKDYLEAYKLSPENSLINLCVGTALINLALGFRLQNKHQCVAQGLAFLYNSLRVTENSQEAWYNIARACHHVGLVSLAVSCYEKVLATHVKDYPIPKLLNESTDPPENLKPGYCDLRREAAYNLHLIYRKSGALDLARQVLRDHCAF